MTNWLSMGVKISAAAALALAVAHPSYAQMPKPAFKPMDVFDLQWVADPEVSPDGRNIAYVRMGYDIKTDRPQGSVWTHAKSVVDRREGKPQRREDRNGEDLGVIESNRPKALDVLS